MKFYLTATLMGAAAIVLWVAVLAHMPKDELRLGWVCGAYEKLDGSEYGLIVCGDETHRPLFFVYVDEETYLKNTHPLGMGYP